MNFGGGGLIFLLRQGHYRWVRPERLTSRIHDVLIL